MTTLTAEELMFDIKPAIDNLTEHQRQLDADGCEVGVSRQALDEVLAHHKAQAAEIERLTREVEKEGRAHSITIDQRDAAEEALGNAYTIVTGQVPEWSNLFDYNAALLEIEEASARATAAEAKVAALEAERNKLRDAVKAHRFAQYGDGYPREGDQQADRNLYAALGAKP